jgi:hypothetical protein
MVLNRYTNKETREFNKCFNDILNYINTLKIDDSKKREKNKIDKINKQVNDCKDIINTKNNEKNKESKLNYYNIYTIDINNFANDKSNLNILTNDIKDILIKHDTKDNILTKYAKIWKTNIDDKTKKEYKKLTKNKTFIKKDYNELLEKHVKTTPKQKRKILNN